MMILRCFICNNKNSTFILQGSGLLESLGLNTPQNSFEKYFVECF